MLYFKKKQFESLSNIELTLFELKKHFKVSVYIHLANSQESVESDVGKRRLSGPLRLSLLSTTKSEGNIEPTFIIQERQKNENYQITHSSP